MKIIKDILKKDSNSDDCYRVTVAFNFKKINLSIDPGDSTLDDMIVLVNKILVNFDFYEKKATDVIVRDFLDNYNANWADEEGGYPQLNEQAFRRKLEIVAIHFYSNDLIDMFYNEGGMFGNHSLIAQSYDGESFDDTTMFG